MRPSARRTFSGTPALKEIAPRTETLQLSVNRDAILSGVVARRLSERESIKIRART